MTRTERRRRNREEDTALLDTFFGIEDRRCVPIWLGVGIWLLVVMFSIAYIQWRVERDMTAVAAPVQIHVGHVDPELGERVAACLSRVALTSPILADVPLEYPLDPFPNLPNNWNEVRIPDAMPDPCRPATGRWTGPLHAEGCPR